MISEEVRLFTSGGLGLKNLVLFTLLVLSGHPNDALNITVLRSSRNAFSDQTVLTLYVREFQAHAASTGTDTETNGLMYLYFMKCFTLFAFSVK